MAANEQCVDADAGGRWSRIAQALREVATATVPLNQSDLLALREQLSSMRESTPPATEPPQLEPAAESGAVDVHLRADRPADRGRDVSPYVVEWETGEGSALLYRCAPAATHGETQLARALGRLDDALVILNAAVVEHRREREVDAIVLTPKGAVTIEQKDVGSSGVLSVPVNGVPALDGQPLENLKDARLQARKHAQVLASVAKQEPAIDLGFIRSVLSIEGPVELTSSPGGNVAVARTAEISAEVDSALARPHRITAPAVRALLDRLELPRVPVEDLATLGFPESNEG